MWSQSELKDVATSPPRRPAAFSSLAASGMCLCWVPSPQLRSERVLEFSPSLSSYTPPSRCLSHPHRNTPSPSALSHSFFSLLRTLSCCADRSDHLPLFRQLKACFLCCHALSASFFLLFFFCSYSAHIRYFPMTKRTTYRKTLK